MDITQGERLSLPPIPVPPIATALTSSSSRTSRQTSQSGSAHSRQSLKSLDRLIGDDRDPKKLRKLVHKLYEQLRFEKERADYADRRASEAMSYLRSICEEKLRALRDISRLEEELKLYKIQYHEAQKEIFRAQDLLGEIDEKRYRAEKEAAEARSAARKMKDEVKMMRAQEEGRREGLQDGFRKGRELGYQEGLRIAQAESENMRRPRALSQIEGPSSRMRNLNHAPEQQQSESQGLQPRHSRVPSAPPSGPPTVTSDTPTSPSVPQGPNAANHSIQPIPEMSEEPEIIQPRSFRNPTPSPRVPALVVPPDNFIPRLDEDNRIHLPPPFEFSRPFERIQSPVSGAQENEEPRMVPPPISTGIRIPRSSSPGSASTTLSQMDMITDPYYEAGRTPMSAIQEVLSQEGSPEARDAAGSRYQPSLSAQSARMMTPGPNEPIYTRPRAVSGASSISFQPPPVIPEGDPRASVSTSSTTPRITVQGPSAPATDGQFNFSRTGPIYGNPNTSESSFLPPIPDPHSHAMDPVGSPTGSAHNYHDHQGANSPMTQPLQPQGGWGMGNTSADSMNPPVIPHPDLFTGGREDDEDEEAVSSGMESMESLTTPPSRIQQLPNKAGSVRSAGGSALSYGRRADGGGDVGGSGVNHYRASVGGSRTGGSRAGSALGSSFGAGNAVGTIPSNRWDEVLRSAQNPPIGMLPVGFHPNAEASGTPAKTNLSKKSRTLSMSTSRSGQQ